MGRRLVRLAGMAAVLLVCTGPAPARAQGPEGSTARIGGATRIETAVEVSRAHWPAATHAVVSTARAFPDALSGTALAAALDAPLLLVEPDGLPAAVAAELVRLGAVDVVVLGGEAAVGPEVARRIARLPTGPSVRRVGGTDRWETSALAVEAALDGAAMEEVAVASGDDFADALGAGAMPGGTRRLPVLLASRDHLPEPSRDVLAAHRPGAALLLGGTAALGAEVEREVAGLAGEVERLAGPDRFATGARAFRAALDRAGDEPVPLVVATGTAFPDALAAGALAARLRGVLLLVPPSGLTDELDALLREHRERLSRAVLVGGRAAVGAHVRSEVTAALDGRPRPAATVTSPGGFRGTAGALPGDVVTRMRGVSWRTGCPVPLGDLSYLEMRHRDFAGGVSSGEMVVHRDVARDVLEVFAALYDARFPVERMRLVDDYGADDDASMDANNTHAFNCRTVAGTDQPSQHSYGWAIDLNPVQNPYVSGGVASPPAGEAYTDRGDVRPGMIVRPGPVVEAFEAVGWGWGGDWRSPKDYHHFSLTGG